jgi:hypothetical protein
MQNNGSQPQPSFPRSLRPILVGEDLSGARIAFAIQGSLMIE